MRQIIVYQANIKNGFTELHWAFWLSVPTNLQAQFDNSGFVSVVPTYNATSCPWGITSTELTNLQNGTYTEVLGQGQLPTTVTAAQVEAYLQNQYSTQQTALNNQAPAKLYVGASYDGTTWSNVPS